MRVARMDMRASPSQRGRVRARLLQGRGRGGRGAHPVAALLPVGPLALLVVVLQVLVLPGHGHGARPVLLNRLGGVGKRAAGPIAAGAGAPHRVATAAMIFAARGPPLLSSVAPPDRVVSAATPLLAVPAARSSW